MPHILAAVPRQLLRLRRNLAVPELAHIRRLRRPQARARARVVHAARRQRVPLLRHIVRARVASAAGAAGARAAVAEDGLEGAARLPRVAGDEEGGYWGEGPCAGGRGEVRPVLAGVGECRVEAAADVEQDGVDLLV